MADTTTTHTFLTNSRVSLGEAIARELEQEITGGELSPGQRLGTKEELRARFGVALATINEAIRLLEMRGMLTAPPGAGRRRLRHARLDPRAAEPLRDGLQVERGGRRRPPRGPQRARAARLPRGRRSTAATPTSACSSTCSTRWRTTRRTRSRSSATRGTSTAASRRCAATCRCGASTSRCSTSSRTRSRAPSSRASTRAGTSPCTASSSTASPRGPGERLEAALREHELEVRFDDVD